MRQVLTLFAAALLSIAGFATAPLQAAEEIENPPGQWRHEASGVVWPKMLGEADRGSITAFDDLRLDVSTGYVLRSSQGVLIMTFYVYPSPSGWSCEETFADARSLVARYDGAQLLWEGAAPSPDGTNSAGARRVRYHIPAGSMREGYPELVSDLYLYCPSGSDWLVKYRASWTGTAAEFPDVPALLTQIAWPEDLR